MSVIMYIKPGCPYCQKARDCYQENNIAFTEYDAENDSRRKREMLEFSDGDPTVPCIVENDIYISSGWGRPPRG